MSGAAPADEPAVAAGAAAGAPVGVEHDHLDGRPVGEDEAFDLVLLSCSRPPPAVAVRPSLTPPIGQSPAPLECAVSSPSPGASRPRRPSGQSCARWGILPERRTAPRHDRCSHRHPPDPPRCPSACSTRGMGGLTVLHECLVQLPGRELRLRRRHGAVPLRGEEPRRAASSSRASSRRSSRRCPCKLIVVACYSATSAALPLLQEQFETPIIGVVMPGARAAVQTSRYRRIGVLATEATVASGAYPRAIHSLDSGAEVIQQACPGLVVVHRGRRRDQPGAGRRGARLHRAAQGAAPGRGHHGLHALPADRAHAAALPRPRRHAGQPGGRDRPRGRGHAAAAGPRAHRGRRGLVPVLHHRRRRARSAVGARFLQMPLTRVRALPLERSANSSPP